jgi:phosphopantetheinyl transferase
MTSNSKQVCSPGRSGISTPSGTSKVQAVTFHGVKEPVNYASVQWTNRSGSMEERKKAKRWLISELLKKCHTDRRCPSKFNERCCSHSLTELSYSHLRQPRLVLDDHEERVAVSVSHAKGRTWAALCYDVQGVGIDAACADEFGGAYPYARAFHHEELAFAVYLGVQDLAEIAALVWTAKEATVKALGCGFHLLDPLDIRIVRPHIYKYPDGLGMVAVIGRKLEIIGGTYEFLPVKIVREFGCWVAIAVTNEDSLP